MSKGSPAAGAAAAPSPAAGAALVESVGATEGSVPAVQPDRIWASTSVSNKIVLFIFVSSVLNK
jgi:hypothetical protein